MANDVRVNPWYLDTVPVTLYMPNWGKVYIKEVRWENFVNGDVLTCTDGDGNPLINETISPANSNFQVMKFGSFGWVNGFACTAIGAAGKLTITITKA